MKDRGIFICFEGGEGSGKTTMANSTAEHLRAFGNKVEEVADPGSTEFALKMRELLLDKEFPCDPWQQVLLYTAARRALALEIRKKLSAGISVVSGRWVWSTLVYQGIVQGVPIAMIEKLHNQFVSLDPDVYILLDADPKIAMKRKVTQTGEDAVAKDRFESMDLAFHNQIRNGYIDVAMRGNNSIVDTGQLDLETATAHVERACLQKYSYRRLTKQ